MAWQDPIYNFFWSEGFVGGLLGAFLIVAASYFVEVRIALKELRWHLKLLFILAGGLTGAIFDHHFELELLLGVGIGAGWTYVIKALRDASRHYVKGRSLSAQELDQELELFQQEIQSQIDQSTPTSSIDGIVDAKT